MESEFPQLGPELTLKDGDLILNVSSSTVHIVFLGTLCRREFVSGSGRFRNSRWTVLGNCPAYEEYAAKVRDLGFTTCADCIQGLKRIGVSCR